MSTAREDFVKRYGAAAKAVTAGTGIFPEVLLAQAIIESSKNGIPGASTLASKYNNYFGIKAYPKWTGKTVNLNTREVVNNQSTYEKANFVVFDSIEDSFKGYVRFLKDNPRYEKAGVFKAKTIAGQIQALKDAGYATDPQYVTLVNSIAVKVKNWIADIPGTGTAAIFIVAALAALFF